MRPAPAWVNGALRAWQPGRRPIFVCGHERSGTTWIGATLARAPGVLWYNEPANWERNPALVTHQMATYLESGERSPHLEGRLDPAFAGLAIRRRSWSLRSGDAVRRVLPGYRVLVKEVNTYLSIEWVVDRYDPQVVVPLRHPGAVVLSIVERGMESRVWLDQMLADERLMAGALGRHRAQMEGATSPWEAAAVQWAARTRVAADQLARHPEWLVVRYEELAADPIAGFRDLFARLGLRWTAGVERYVQRTTTTPGGPHEEWTRVSADRIDRWRSELGSELCERVRKAIEPFELPFDVRW